MLIGSDYPKIEWEFLGLDLVEPNAFIGDTLIFIVALIYFAKVKRILPKTPFLDHWSSFYLIFGIGFFAGGLGHLFFNYWGVPGKYVSYFFGILSPYFIEQAMISIYPKKTTQKTLDWLSKGKLIVATLGQLYMISYTDIAAKIELGMIFPTLTSAIGLILSLGVLGAIYQKKIHPSFKYMWMASVILLPSALFQVFKISPMQWFDRNDVSHLFLLIGMVYYYKCIKRYSINE